MLKDEEQKLGRPLISDGPIELWTKILEKMIFPFECLKNLKINVESPQMYRDKAYINMNKKKLVTGQGKYTDPIKRWKG